jgi:hypothetical protein
MCRKDALLNEDISLGVQVVLYATTGGSKFSFTELPDGINIFNFWQALE